MNGTRMVRFKNTKAETVIVHEPAYGIHREFLGKGTVQVIPFDTVEQLLWRPGFANLIKSGILYIEDMQDKIDLGLEDPDTKTPTKIRILTPEQILTLLKVKDYDNFVKDIEGLSIDQVNNIVDFAVENEILDTKKINYLKELTDRDVLKILARKREMAEADQANAEKEAARRREGEFNSI